MLSQRSNILTETLDQKKLELDQKDTQIEALARKLEASLSANKAFQDSRDQIWEMYRRSSLGAGNAQAWLFRELGNAMAEVNKHRAKNGEAPIQTPPGLEDVLKEFREEHYENNNKPGIPA